MGKTKASATGKGYLGEIMVHRISGEVGVVENVVEAQAGWPPQIALRSQKGTIKKGSLGDFKDATAAQKHQFASAQAKENAAPE